ncbi:unnamed protein product [Cylindrotheca closterium]|uniref:Uncharacterized protein n=1 Tax=Cylindrotheca closterium TaxID=2856 RepID=A0AAD2G2I8_9STRA|nr:unnamed protein product [Cylindrotheca closterium]
MKYSVICSSTLSLWFLVVVSVATDSTTKTRARNLRGKQTKVFIPISQPGEVQDIIEAKKENEAEEPTAWEKEEAYLESLGITGEEEGEDPESTWEKEEAYIESLENGNDTNMDSSTVNVVEEKTTEANAKDFEESLGEQEDVIDSKGGREETP